MPPPPQAQTAAATVLGRGAHGLVELLAGGRLAAFDLGHPPLQHRALAIDGDLGVGQRGALRLELGLDTVGAHRQAGDVGLAFVQLDVAQLHAVVTRVELALAGVE